MSFEAKGWLRVPHEPSVAHWVGHTAPIARNLAADRGHIKDWLRCGGTWFAGVNILPNDGEGATRGGPPLTGTAITTARALGGWSALDPAQISVIYPGYPKPMQGETDAAFRFRRDRDAAHVDGLLPVGPKRRRHLHEPHAFVLGLPLSDTTASPMVIWEASHLIMRDAFAKALRGVAPENWSAIDLTDTYHAARKLCFETCKRTTVHAKPGEAYLIHRLALHGVAPWQDGDHAPPEGRMIAYFRPELDDVANWLG